MNAAFYIGATGLVAQQHALDVIANNIANINTTGFKRSTARFADMVAPVGNVDGDLQVPANYTANLSGVFVSATDRVWTQGDVRQTGQQLDLAIDGGGFIELTGLAGRSLLWRGGTLKVNADGMLATSDGTPLRAMVSVPLGATALTIARDGTVSATIEGETTPREIGRIELIGVKDPASLAPIGNGYFEAADAADTYTIRPGETGQASLVQGALEASNIQLSDEMTDLLLVQRAFGANAQIVQASDQLMSLINNLRR